MKYPHEFIVQFFRVARATIFVVGAKKSNPSPSAPNWTEHGLSQDGFH